MAVGKEALEAKLLEDPDDVATYLVYADWLQQHGDPRGELIALHHAGKTDEAAAHVERHADRLLGPLARYARTLDGSNAPAFGWHLGFIRSARLSFDSNVAAEDGDDDGERSIEDALEQLLAHPSGALLRELVVPINMLDDGCYFEPVCKALATHGAPSLRRLRLGEYTFAGPRGPAGADYEYEISWTSFGDMSGMWKAVPRLEHLVLQGALGAYNGAERAAHFGTIVLPRLRHAELVSGGISSECVRAIASATWPELRHLDVWLGNAMYGFTGGLDDIAPILAGRGLDALEHLGIMNCEYTDELCAALPSAPVLRRLRELSLALGTLSDGGAEELVRHAEAYRHLDLLDLEHNCLSEEGRARVQGLCKEVRAAEQQEQYGEDERYVAVGE